MHNEVSHALRILLMAAPLALSACVFPGSRPQALITAATPDTVRLGDSVAVRVTVKNISKRSLWMFGGPCSDVFQAVNKAGEQVGSRREGSVCTPVLLLILIEPGQQHEQVDYWLGYSYMMPRKRVTVAPGMYHIVPTVGCCSKDIANRRFVRVRTVESTITVVQ